MHCGEIYTIFLSFPRQNERGKSAGPSGIVLSSYQKKIDDFFDLGSLFNFSPPHYLYLPLPLARRTTFSSMLLALFCGSERFCTGLSLVLALPQKHPRKEESPESGM